MKTFLSLGVGLLAMAGSLALGRTFTDVDGRTIEAELISATETEIVVKVKGKLRTHTIKISRLSEADQEFVAKKRKEIAAEKAKKAGLKAISKSVVKLVEFVENNKGRKVGNGECWTLADEAFKSAKISRPGSNNRVWGGVVDWENEDVLPGDILELKSAKFSNGRWTAPEHTAVIMKKGIKKGEMVVYHQNWGRPGKIVSELFFDLNTLVSGEAIIYRFGKR